MINSIENKKIYEEDFTTDNFRKLIQIAKRRFRFTNYHDFDQENNFILWRHDIDLSVDYSLKLATIENQEGVNATYFVLTHGEFYSPFESQTLNILHQIADLGHEIGIHFDTHFYDINNESDLEKALNKEIYIFKEVLGFNPRTFSFHNPNELILSFNKEYYCGLRNTYSKNIISKVPYCSDSNGYWRFDRLEDKLLDTNIQNLQVLTHPGWWQEEVKKPSDRVKYILKQRADVTWNIYADMLRRRGRNNL